MHTDEPILAQYHVFAERRLHFGKLFWINIAFFLTLLLLAADLFKDIGPPALWWAILVAGLATLQISYITHRIRTVEDTYERLMSIIEERLRAAGHADCQVAPLSKKIWRALPGDRRPGGRRRRPDDHRRGQYRCGMMRIGPLGRSRVRSDGHARAGGAITMTAPDRSFTGGCLCGAVRFEASGEPLWIAHCHCASCRRNTGAAVATFVGVRRDGFRYRAGKPAVYESSPSVWRSFCRACGTPLTYEAARCADEVHINIGTLDEPAAFAPTMHVHVAERLPWLHMDDGLPRCAASSPNAQPMKSGPAPSGPDPERNPT